MRNLSTIRGLLSTEKKTKAGHYSRRALKRLGDYGFLRYYPGADFVEVSGRRIEIAGTFGLMNDIAIELAEEAAARKDREEHERKKEQKRRQEIEQILREAAEFFTDNPAAVA